MSNDSVKKKPKYQIVKNSLLVSSVYNPKRFEDSLTYAPESDDVFICTYPKSGTTWAQYILYLMLSKGKPLKENQCICSVIPHLEDDGKTAVQCIPRPRAIKTHLPYHMLPKNKNAKYIFIARNPKDCCVSFFHHTKGFKGYENTDGTFDDYFELFLSGEVDYGDYFDHLLYYLPHKNDSNMLFLLYEEMKLDIRESIQKIGRFLGGPFFESIKDRNIFEKIVQNCEFRTMKCTPSMWSTKRIEGSTDFLRKGEIGDWRNHVTEEQSKKMDQKFKAKLGGTEAEHFWNKYSCL